jgi:2-dehydropantoate 2-reductase
MGIGFGEDVVPVNLKISAGLSPDMTTSLQRDIVAGKASEIDGLIYDVVRMGERYGVSMPLYEKISAELKRRYS